MNIQRPQSEFLTIAYTWAALSLVGADHALVHAEGETTEDAYRYDPAGKRDPFLSPFYMAPTPIVPQSEIPEEAQMPPLQRFDLKQLTLVGVILGAGEAQALIKDREGHRHIVTSGTPIGTKGGVIKAIESERIVVEEYEVDLHGERRAKERELHLSIAESPGERKRTKVK